VIWIVAAAIPAALLVDIETRLLREIRAKARPVGLTAHAGPFTAIPGNGHARNPGC